MDTPNFCPCGMARDATTTPTHDVFTCEHCDRPCDERRCNECSNLARHRGAPAP